MTEQESRLGASPWKLHEIAASLGTSLNTCDDVVRGQGYRLTFPEVSRVTPTILELYPVRLVARYRSPLLELDLARVHRIEPLEKKVRIEAGTDTARAVAFVESEGTLQFSVVPVLPVVTTEAATVPPETPAPQTPAPEPTTHAEQERVNLVGRIGAEPSFRTTPKGVLIARFPVAVRESEDKTIWHNVLAFGSRAVKLEGAIKKGDAVEVIGYKHEREIVRKDGSKKTVEEVYAVVVKNR